MVLTICSNGSTPLNKMVAMPHVCSNDGRRLTLDLFYGKVKFASPYICMGKC